MPHRDKLRMVMDRSPESGNLQKMEIDPTGIYELSSGEKIFVNGILDHSPGNVDVLKEGNVAIFTRDQAILAQANAFLKIKTICSRFYLMRQAGDLDKTVYEKQNRQTVLVFEELTFENGKFAKTGKNFKFVPR